MFDNLKAKVKDNKSEAEKCHREILQVADGLDGRVTALENDLQILKSMQKTDDGSPGLFEMLQEMRAQIKKEMDEKHADLLKRIAELEVAMKSTDDK